jgi:predicted nucleotidyltransferase
MDDQWGDFDIAAARRNVQKREQARRTRLNEAWRSARDEADRVVALIVEKFMPSRIVQWGSILRPDRFTEVSDIDIAVEGINDPETWSRMEREVESIVTFPLDLVPLDRIRTEFRSQILESGEVVYEREQ